MYSTSGGTAAAHSCLELNEPSLPHMWAPGLGLFCSHTVVCHILGMSALSCSCAWWLCCWSRRSCPGHAHGSVPSCRLYTSFCPFLTTLGLLLQRAQFISSESQKGNYWVCLPVRSSDVLVSHPQLWANLCTVPFCFQWGKQVVMTPGCTS